MVKIKIKIGTPRTNSMYVRDKVLEILLFDILPIPRIKPRKRAITKDTRVDPKVIRRPGII
jgi:hypothetical protein